MWGSSTTTVQVATSQGVGGSVGDGVGENVGEGVGEGVGDGVGDGVGGGGGGEYWGWGEDAGVCGVPAGFGPEPRRVQSVGCVFPEL